MQIAEPADNTIAMLRALVPHRRLSHGESLRLAELQANRLLETFKVAGPLVPDELVTELPRISVRYDADLPASGSAHWESARWVITLNATEPHVRQRFSLMHELKHIIDHSTKQYLYGDTVNDEEAAQRAERAADVFAAAVLMPKRWIKAEWYASGQNLTVLARRCGVSTRALSVRLYHLGLAEDTDRCRRTTVRRSRSFRYERARSPVGVSP